MKQAFRSCWAVFLFLTTAILLAGCVTTAEEERIDSKAKGPEIRLTPNGLAEDGNPPITIGSFDYSFIKRGGIHMNICRQASCVPGSRVSYVLYGRTGKPDFEEFKVTQGKVFSALKARASKSVTMNLAPAERSSGEVFTIYTSVREARLENGEALFTKSTLIYRESTTISVISSAKDMKTTDANRALFMTALMLWGQVQANKDKSI